MPQIVHVWGDAGLVLYLATGLLVMPIPTALIVTVVVFVVGAPAWSLANARGLTTLGHAVLAGAIAGALVGAVEFAFTLARLVPVNWPALVLQYIALVVVGTVAGFTARLVAGPPKLPPTTL
jgi:hypothetical protein